MITRVVTLFKVSRFQQKIMRHAEKQESVAHTADWGGREGTVNRNYPKGSQDTRLKTLN